MGVFAPSRAVAPPGYNRWLVPPAALALHLSIGQVYAFSVLKTPLVERFDGSQTSIAVIFSLAIVMLGCSAAFLGSWVQRVGPRMAMAVSTLFWVSGFLVAALGVATGQLWLLYLGYGVIGGIGLGIGYLAPVSTLMAWFPDRPGLATGMAVMGFGGGALVASPLTSLMLDRYASTPAQALVPALLTLAAGYAVLMSLGVLVMRTPPPDYRVPGTAAGRTADAPVASVTAREAVRTPQFALLWVVLFAAATGGIGILEQAAPMVQSYFGVEAAVAAGFVGVLSLANMAGRIGWSALSDRWGRRLMYVLYLGGGAAAYLVLALAGGSSVLLFVLLAAAVLSFYGGNFATIPAYVRDLFGAGELSAVLGRLLTAWAAAGVAGPLIVNFLTDARAEEGISGAALYRPSMFVIMAVLVAGLVANVFVRPLGAGRSPAQETVVAASRTTPEDAGGKAARAEDPGTSQVPAASGGASGTLAAAASALWALVGVLLVYGIFQTVLRASALFG